MEIKKEFEYQLQQSFDYAHKGATVPASKITVKCPSNKVLKSLSVIESEFMAAITKAQQATTQEAIKEAQANIAGEGELDGKSAIMALLSFGNINTCYDEFKIILTKTAFVDDDEKFEKPMWDDLSVQDTKALLGEYLVNFILSSLLT